MTKSRNIELYDVQHDFFSCPENLSAFIGGIGSGKTYVGALKALHRMKPGTLGMIVSPTYKMLKDSTLRTFFELGEGVIVDWNKADMVVKARGGGEALLRSADSPETLRGPNLHWAWIDEGGLTKDEVFDIVLGRMRGGGEFGEIWTTSTPKGKNNWLYEKSHLLEMFRATTLDNPNTSLLWKQELLRQYTGSFLKQEVFADFVGFEGLVYDMFDESQHVVRLPGKELTEFEFAIDEGYTNPAVILRVGIKRTGGYHIIEEWYKRKQLHEDIVSEVLRQGGENKTAVVDEAAAALIAALRSAGVWVTPGKGKVLNGIRKVQSLMSTREGGPALTVDPSCVNTINEFESYVWKEGRDEPVKEYDHSMDAIRYYFDNDVEYFSPTAKVDNYAR